MKILIVKNRALGDAIIGLGSLQYLRQMLPDSEIFYAIPSWIAPLFNRIDNSEKSSYKIIPLKLTRLIEWWEFYNALRSIGSFDLIIELNQNGRTRKFFSIYKFFSKSRYFYHNHHKKNANSIILDQGKVKPNIQRDLDGIYSILKYNNLINKNEKTPSYLNYSPKLNIKKNNEFTLENKNKIILGMVATRSTKMWPIKNFIELINLINNKYNKKFEFIIPLSSNELDQSIEKNLREYKLESNVKIIKEPLEHLPQIFIGTKIYIGNDTGIKHLSVSLNIPTISFFGPEEPIEWHPYDTKLHPYFFIDGLECRTKISHYCPLNQCESMICLSTITPTQVYLEAEKILQLG